MTHIVNRPAGVTAIPLGPVVAPACLLPFGSKVAAGFPSPAADHEEEAIDLAGHLVRNPAATFLMRASGTSMTGLGIHDGDLLVVDRSIKPITGMVVVASLNDELTVKRFRRRAGRVWLEPANPDFPPLEVTEQAELVIWGVVRHAIHNLMR